MLTALIMAVSSAYCFDTTLSAARAELLIANAIDDWAARRQANVWYRFDGTLIVAETQLLRG
jgi:hypothetical protein